MTERKDIGLRLENWARWATARQSRGADCMTGAVCDRMRRSALGDVWSGHDVRKEINEADAVLLERAMPMLDTQPRLLLWWCYIRNAPPEVVCRKLSIPIRPSSIFVEMFRAAQDSVEATVDNLK